MSERKLAAQNLRTEAAVNMAAKIANMTPEEISMQIDGEARAQGFIPRVFIVDDEVESRHLFKEALASFTVVEADDGKEALEVMQEEEVGLVITGIDMPSIDGFSLLEVWRRRYPQLSMLALSNDSDIDEVRASEFDGCIARAAKWRNCASY